MRGRQLGVFVGLIIFAVLVSFLVIKGLNQHPKEIPSVLIGKDAPNFNTLLLQGQDADTDGDGRLRLGELKGRNIVLNFWASWCVSCREEARDFQAFYLKHRDDGVFVMGIAIQDTPEAAKEFAQTYGKTYTLALDDSGNSAIDFGVTGVPETFWIDRSGKIVDKFAGPLTSEVLEEKMKVFENQ